MPKAKTNTEFYAEINLKYGNKYTLKSPYKNNRSKISFFCNGCHSEHMMIAQHLLNNGCSKCGRRIGANKNTLSEDQFQERLFKKCGSRIISKEPYIKRDEKILFYSFDCNHYWRATPDAVLGGNGCNECALERSIKTRTKTHEQFIFEVKELVGHDYKVIGEYTKTNKTLEFLHISCGNYFPMTPNSFLGGHRCPSCYGTPKKTTEQFKKEIFDLVGDEYRVIGEYLGNKNEITFEHVNCKESNFPYFKMRPNSFLSANQRCPKCSPSKKDTKESFEAKLLKKRGNEYELIGEYINSWTIVELVHKCGYVWNVTPSNVLNGQNCPRCSKSIAESKGERKIRKYLENCGISFKQEHSFKGLISKRSLRFDFVIFSNQNPVMMIEFQGIQHYQPIAYFGGMEKYKQQIQHDILKAKYAKEKNLSLLIIPYWHYNDIGNILDGFIKKHLIQSHNSDVLK
ncbi:hypothetical protein [Bacillus sp. 1NLA3E]|uniref:hypothetical protein n=1 Tax=Bacillus sp. 1NLA3E TaxID=666686 RepID=UPI000247E6FD|nr:hypothetical protein [Bacillus sp. 1NLA3E]AGK54891.1 hypothetical protein B1NLA3E_15725 [Bacillus sp. 1NLA3E]